MSYDLPMSLSTAITINREVFVDLWIKENPKERSEIGVLLKDLIHDRVVLKSQVSLLRERCNNAVATLQSFALHVDQIDNAISGHSTEVEEEKEEMDVGSLQVEDGLYPLDKTIVRKALRDGADLRRRVEENTDIYSWLDQWIVDRDIIQHTDFVWEEARELVRKIEARRTTEEKDDDFHYELWKRRMKG